MRGVSTIGDARSLHGGGRSMCTHCRPRPRHHGSIQQAQRRNGESTTPFRGRYTAAQSLVQSSGRYPTAAGKQQETNPKLLSRGSVYRQTSICACRHNTIWYYLSVTAEEAITSVAMGNSCDTLLQRGGSKKYLSACRFASAIVSGGEIPEVTLVYRQRHDYAHH